MLDTNHTDYTGQTFRQITVLSFAGLNDKNMSLWLVECTCCNQVIKTRRALHGENTHSCGCVGRQRRSESRLTHGLSGTPIYHIWHGMISRCHNPDDAGYSAYGGAWHKGLRTVA